MFYHSCCQCVYLIAALKLTQGANEHSAHVPLCMCVGLCFQAESVQDAGEEADVVTNLHAVPKLHQSQQVPHTGLRPGDVRICVFYRIYIIVDLLRLMLCSLTHTVVLNSSFLADSIKSLSVLKLSAI